MSDVFLGDAPDLPSLPDACATCLHLRGMQPHAWFCDAFPSGIPQVVASGRSKHRRRIVGDHGIHWEPDPDVAAVTPAQVDEFMAALARGEFPAR